jgi:putative transposase
MLGCMIFFEDGDQEIYRDLLAKQTRKAQVEVWAYCLMPNHVDLILIPRRADDLGLAFGEAHPSPSSDSYLPLGLL